MIKLPTEDELRADYKAKLNEVFGQDIESGMRDQIIEVFMLSHLEYIRMAKDIENDIQRQV